MRIISGKLKGRSLLVPKNFGGRPTTDFAREGLFNVLNNLIEFQGLRVLDLFAGTGAFGLECFSRGADSVRFIEISGLHAKFISDNLKHFEIKNASVSKGDVFKLLPLSTEKLDLIFADPPFDLDKLETLPDLVLQSNLLNEGGLFVLEHGRDHDFENHPCFIQHRKYSNVHFSFFEK